jgi:hypothetical protein
MIGAAGGGTKLFFRSAIFHADELRAGAWPHHLQDAKRSPMTEFLVYLLVPLSVGVVAVVLLFGLANFAQGGSPQRSQKLMRLRVLMQFVAIIVIMLTIWAMGR